MAGFTLLEILIVLSISLILSASYCFYLGDSHSQSLPSCIKQLDEFLSHARARAMAAKTESQITFNIEENFVQPNWREAPLRFPDTCKIRAAVFGVQGEQEAHMLYYPSGNASPGHVLIEGPVSTCRYTQTIRGARTTRCVP